MQEYRWIDHCCKPAIKDLNKVGIKTTTNKQVLGRWNAIFSKLGKFPHPNPNIANGKKKIPKLFEYFPKSVDLIKRFISNKLATFNVTLLEKELPKTILPTLMKDLQKDINLDEDTLESRLLQMYMDKPPSFSTVYQWVKYLGYKMGNQTKLYYVDGHEHPDQRKHRVTGSPKSI